MRSHMDYEAECERWLNKRPVCSVCNEHIQDDYLYRITFRCNEEIICESCMESFREDTEKWCSED